MFDRLANGVDFPSEARYDDDYDLTELNSWSESDRSIMICTTMKVDMRIQLVHKWAEVLEWALHIPTCQRNLHGRLE